MRPQQHKNNRGRSRNRRSGGGSGQSSGGGGNGANRVYDSNGPDVKLRGTAQTIAEKYMQLGRDAQSSGDTVMAESYFQFGDHYYRVWLAAQPAGQPLQFSRRMAEEELEDEGGDNEGDDEAAAEGNQAEGSETPEGQAGGDESVRADDASGEGQQQARNQQPRDNQQRDNREGRNFRQRWPRRNERQNNPEGQQAEGSVDRPERTERPERAERQPRQVSQQASEEAGNWEAPSFLRRPAPAVEAAADAVAEPAAPRARRVRSEEAAPTEDIPQGE